MESLNEIEKKTRLAGGDLLFRISRCSLHLLVAYEKHSTSSPLICRDDATFYTNNN